MIEAHGIQIPSGIGDVGGMAQMAPHLSGLLTGRGSPQHQQDSYPGTPTHHQAQNHHQYPPQPNQFVQIKQEPAQSPVPQHFGQYSITDDFPGINFAVADLVNMMDTSCELDPMVSSINPFDAYNTANQQQQLDMDYLT